MDTPPTTQSLLTIGYQGRTLTVLVNRLLAHNVRILIDVRESARSRRPDFNAQRLADAVRANGIGYVHLPNLGSKAASRRELHATGDFERFAGFYLSYVRRWRVPELRELYRLTSREGVACILCYEADHEQCHRSIIAREATRLYSTLAVQHI